VRNSAPPHSAPPSIAASSAGSAATPACPLVNTWPSCASSASIVDAPANAAPARLARRPSKSRRASASRLVICVAAYVLAIDAAGIREPPAATPIKSRTQRLPCPTTSAGRTSKDSVRTNAATSITIVVPPVGEATAIFIVVPPRLRTVAATLCPLPPEGKQFAPSGGPAALMTLPFRCSARSGRASAPCHLGWLADCRQR